MMKSMLFALLLSAACVSVDAEEAKLIAGVPGVIESKPAKGTLPAKNRTVLGLTLGKHTLGDVKAKLGNAPVSKTRDAEGRPNTLCYAASKATDNTVVVFEAGPLGGYEELTSITVGPSDAFSAAFQDCTKSDIVDRSAAAAGKLRLGGDIGEVASSLRVKVARTKVGLIELPFETPTRLKDKRTGKLLDGDTLSGVIAKDSDGRIQWFSVYFGQAM
jgi:hypothetical protein